MEDLRRECKCALVKAGVSCQLKFLEGEGDRDKVVIYDEAGKELAAHADMQHNKNYGQLRQNNAAMSQKVLAALGKSEVKAG